MNQWMSEWMNSICMQGTSDAIEREGDCSRTVVRSGDPIYPAINCVFCIHTYISTLFCVCVCVCELTVSWQLKRLSRVYWPAAGAPKQQSCNSGLGYCNENLFKLENANCIRAVAEGRGCRLLVLVLMLSGLRLATWNALKIMLPARFGHLFCVMLDACCLLSGAAEKGQLELL